MIDEDVKSVSSDDIGNLMTVGENGSTDDENYSGNVFLKEKSVETVAGKCLFEFPEVDMACKIEILQETRYALGGKIWEAASCLTRYLIDTRHLDKSFVGSIVELGSGTGLVGLLSAMMVSATSIVYLTDLDVVMPVLERNVAHNQSSLQATNAAKVRTEELWWGTRLPNHLQHPKVVLVADCVYIESAFIPLLKTLWDMCDTETIIYFCWKKRWRSSKRFFNKLKKLFDMTTDDPRAKENAKESLYIYTIRKKANLPNGVTVEKVLHTD